MNESIPSGALGPGAEVRQPLTPLRAATLQRTMSLAVVVLPFAGLVSGIVLLWGYGVGWFELCLLLVMYLLTAIGVTVGLHRHFAHRSFETYRFVQFVLAALGSMAVEGPILKWVAVHRRHHQHSDEERDPHSPHHQGSGFLGLLRGAWHAHLGWLFDADPSDLSRYVKDLRRSRLLRSMSALFPAWVLVSLLVPTIIGGCVYGSLMGALLGLIWGGLVRIFLVHHVTWSINSDCHLWGRRPFALRDQSRNNLLFGILGLGEGWHNNHHAFPASASHGLRWWEIDVSYWLIRALAAVRLAWKVRLPPKSLHSVSSA